MTVGIVSPTAGITEDQFVAAQEAAADRAEQRRLNIEAGLAALGYVQTTLRDTNGQPTATTYEQRRPAQSDLPASLVDAARAAVDRASAAIRALVKRDAETLAWCQRHGVGGEAAMTKMTLERAELSTAALEADRDAAKALHALGDVARQVEQARQVLAQVDGRKAAIERQAAALLQVIADEEATARATLTRCGVV